MKLLVTRHPAVRAFAAKTVKPDQIITSLTPRHLEVLPDRSAVFGNLPIPVVNQVCRPRYGGGNLRYFHLIIPGLSQGMPEDLEAAGAFWQRFLVEEGGKWLTISG